MIVCLDANCVIYLLEQHPVWGPKITARLSTVQSAGGQLAACDLARAECLIGPLAKGDVALLADYQRFFASRLVTMLPITPAACERAAKIRVASAMQFHLPDALHLATAAEHGCGLFLTNDAKLLRCSDLPVELLT